MESSATLPQSAPLQPGISPTFSWTDANSLTLDQICKDLGISETELDHCMPQTLVGYNGRPTNAGVARTQSRRLPKKSGDQLKEGDCQTDFSTNKCAKVAK